MSFRVVASWLTSSPRCLHASKLCVAESSSSKATFWTKSLHFADRTHYSTDASTNALPHLKRLNVHPEAIKIIHPTKGNEGEASVPEPETSSNELAERRKTRRLKSRHRNPSLLKNNKPKQVDDKEASLLGGFRQQLHDIEKQKPRPNSKLSSTPSGKKSHKGSNLSSVAAAAKEVTDHIPESWADEPWNRGKKSHQNPNLSSLPTAVGQITDHIPETWADEPWNHDETMTVIDRSFPPHDPPLSLVQEGKIVENSGTKVESILTDVLPLSKHHPVAKLSHGLDRVLFNPGVHWLQDPRSHVYNFTPWLERIPKVNDFAFERLTGFIRSSRDEDLRALATQENKKFVGSTSSLSGMLSHIYFLLTEYKEIDCTILSQHFQNEPTTFTPGQRMPAMVMLNCKDGIYAVDSHSSEWDDPDRNVLTWMGTLLENLLTKSPEEFNTFMRLESAAPSQDNDEPILKEAYRYAKSDNFIMRSQLDCHDSRLPGTGVFDLKTRACVTIRMDVLNYEENAGYLIKTQHGILQSFEKEYYDLIRSAFLKYSFQVRIGNMDGVLVTYHNTERIFGFQYISLDEMDERLLGPTPGIGDKLFNHSVKLLEAVLEEASACFPGQSVLCLFETPRPGKFLDVYVQPGERASKEDERPIKQLRVLVTHELDGTCVRPDAALMSTSQQWDIKYKISSLNISNSAIRDMYNTALQRKKRTLNLPSSVSLEEAEEYWENLSFGKKMLDTTLRPSFSPDSFVLAQESVEKYRRLAREGRIESQRKEELLAGRPKIVYGLGVYEPEESPFFKEPTKEESSIQQDEGDGEIKLSPE